MYAPCEPRKTSWLRFAGPVTQVHWAGGRLVTVDPRGNVRFGTLDASGTVAAFADAGLLRDVAWNESGVVARNTPATAAHGTFGVSSDVAPETRRPARLFFGPRTEVVR
jgi:hypothetical protein